MSARRDVVATRSWVADGTRLVQQSLEALDEGGLSAPSLLPGWSRAHVVAHLARNAEALTRLATWARTGVPTPMYAGPEQRDADIETSARRPAPELRHDVAATAADLEQALDALDDTGWQARVSVRQGQEIQALLLPWLRTREVWLHAVDLDVGADLAAAPQPLLDELADDIGTQLSKDPACPAVELRPTDRSPGTTWQIGGEGRRDGDHDIDGGALSVQGRTSDLVLWLAGRSDGTPLRGSGPLPTLPDWL